MMAEILMRLRDFCCFPNLMVTEENLKLVRLLIIGLLACSLSTVTAQQSSGPVQIETLTQTTKSWDGTPYKAYPAGQPQISVLKVTLAPHTAMKWHTHPVPNAGYVLSGEITAETKDGAKKHFVAGDVIPETVDIVHRGVSEDQPVVLIVFYAGTPGVPLSQPAGDGQ
jgi:quercetin dioxygenase-like cupin family protein